MEPTPELYVEHIVQVLREVKRALRDDGTLWLNLGDSYYGSWGNYGGRNRGNGTQREIVSGSLPSPAWDGREEERPAASMPHSTLKPKDLLGIPWRVAFALQDDGWYLRSDIIWCLSGGTWLYARTKKGDMPVMLRDAARLKPETVQLWNGEKWTHVLGWSKTSRHAGELEITLRSGERISCTPNHEFPTNRGLLAASQLVPGDRLLRTAIPEPQSPLDSVHIAADAAWLAGLYIAEGSRSEDTIQISGHAKEEGRWIRLQSIVKNYGGACTRTINGNEMAIRLYGKLLNAILDHLVTGTTAKTKAISPVCWRYSNGFLLELLAGYLSGDGHWEARNKRWKLGFCRNYNLERDLRALSARLGFHLVLKLSVSSFRGRKFPSFRGELRFERSNHWNQKHSEEILFIKNARCREVYDVGVADDPQVFALASGILTHNSKPNPMPESVRDRPTKAHEYVFLLSKQQKYYWDQKAVREPLLQSSINRLSQPTFDQQTGGPKDYGIRTNANRSARKALCNLKEKLVAQEKWGDRHAGWAERDKSIGRNIRSVWTIPTQPYIDAHFATFPEELVRRCILAGSPPGGLVLDPFGGTGTVAKVAINLGRRAIHCDLAYVDQAIKRTTGAQYPLMCKEGSL